MADAIEPGHLGAGLAAGDDAFSDLAPLARVQLLAAATYLTNAGVPVFIDPAPGIAHSKVMVLDGATVVTRSFNFTAMADTRNVENVVVLRSPEVAGWYGRAWNARRAVSRAFGAGAPGLTD